MIHVIDNVLSDEELDGILQFSYNPTIEWYDGKKSATGIASEIKHSYQYKNASDEDWMYWVNVFKKRLISTEAYNIFCADMPVLLDNLIRLNRYDKGMGYGWHTDSWYIGWPGEVPEPTYTNYALNLCVNDEYEGGDFEIKLPNSYINGKQEIKTFKPKKGRVVIWPTNFSHRVRKVTKGSRLAITGWLTHNIKDYTELADMIIYKRMAINLGKIHKSDDIDKKDIKKEVMRLQELRGSLIRKTDLTK